MMMRYLGWGIGHCNPPDFAHEANALIASISDRELEQYENPFDKIQPTMELDEREGGESSDAGDSESDPESDHEVVAYDY
jgi:hypothetical protein